MRLGSQVLSKITLLLLLALFVGRVLFRKQMRELGKRFDSFINTVILAIAISYTIQLAIVLSR